MVEARTTTSSPLGDPILQGVEQLNDYERTSTHESEKRNTHATKPMSGIVDTADETAARSKHFILYVCRPPQFDR